MSWFGIEQPDGTHPLFPWWTKGDVYGYEGLKEQDGLEDPDTADLVSLMSFDVAPTILFSTKMATLSIARVATITDGFIAPRAMILNTPIGTS